jgi:signal transduction histidine kinase
MPALPIPVSESAHSTIWLLSLQGELAMQIGTSLDSALMLQNFLLTLTRRLQLRAAQVWWHGAEGDERHAYPGRSIDIWQANAQLDAWCVAFLAESSEVNGHFEAQGAFRALRINKSAALFLEESDVMCSLGTLAVLEALMPRLAFACQACLDHRHSRALLELTRLQNRELEEARERAEAAWRSKSEFLAAISHEMRTPLNSVLGFSELLALELAGNEMAEYANTIYSSGRHLLAMFNDLLDLAKLDARRLVLHPEDVGLRQLCEDLWMPYAAEARSKGLSGVLRLSDKLPSRIVVDPVRLRQIINNLLGNALKFTHQGCVELSVSLVDGMVNFAVSDSGPGIPSEAHARVFERFSQAGHGAERNAEGTGLGLAIARELAETMGGFILLESSRNGSTFSLVLPPVAPGLLDE